MKFLVSICFILAITSQSFAFDWWNDLRSTWGRVPTEGYDPLPKNTRDAVLSSWILRSTECTNNGTFNGFRYTHPSDTGVALLFDVHGHVGGVQSLVPNRDLDVVGSTYKFDQQPMFQNHTIDGVTYFVVTIYFQVPSKLCSNASSVIDDDDAALSEGNIGRSSLVYFQNGPSPSQLKIAYKSRTDAYQNGWTNNECLPGMGWHNFYRADHWQETNCDDYQPTCLLYNENDELFGFCLLYPGSSTLSNRWEHPTSAAIAALMGPETPQCLIQQIDRVGFTTLHVYFTNTPWETGC